MRQSARDIGFTLYRLTECQNTVELALRSKSEHARLGPGTLVREETNTDGTTTSYWQLNKRHLVISSASPLAILRSRWG